MNLPVVSSRVVVFAYVRSLVWLAILVAVVVGVQNIVGLVLIDFIHGNPHRTQGNAIFMMVAFTPLFGLVALIRVLLVFTLPQCFQAMVSNALMRRFGSRAQASVLLVLPITAVITWYCYDYLTPSDVGFGINAGPDWRQHGLTLAHYTAALAFQVPATLFSVAYAAAGAASPSRRTVVLLALAAAIITGGIMGHHAAESQYQFL